MFPLTKKPKTADLSRFPGKDIVQRYPARMKNTAVFMVNCKDYYIHSKHSMNPIYVVLERRSVYAVVDANGDDIYFAETPEKVIEHHGRWFS